MVRLGLYLTALVMVVAGANHFMNPRFYLRIMPPWLPGPVALNVVAGVAEVLVGVGLLYGPTRVWAAWGFTAMMVVFLVVHMQHVVAPPFAGFPWWGYWGRLVLQFGLIYWGWWLSQHMPRE